MLSKSLCVASIVASILASTPVSKFPGKLGFPVSAGATLSGPIRIKFSLTVDASVGMLFAKVIAKLISDLIEDNMDKENYPIVVKYSELLSDKLKKMRLCGLDKGGEYSVENLSYKLLRRSGHLQKLWDAKLEAYDKMMSI